MLKRRDGCNRVRQAEECLLHDADLVLELPILDCMAMPVRSLPRLRQSPRRRAQKGHRAIRND
jgi:hypothetical protein